VFNLRIIFTTTTTDNTTTTTLCSVYISQGSGTWVACDAVKVPLHIQPAWPVTYLSRPDNDHTRSLRQSLPVPSCLAQRVHTCVLWQTNQRNGPRYRERTL